MWAPAVPFSTAPACTVNTSSFSCHLHTNGGFTLERSKSDVQAHAHFHSEYSKKATFYTDNHKKTTEEQEHSSSEVYSLERSKTAALLPGSMNPINTSIFDNRPTYSRTAPSPPVRTKMSPSSRRVEITQEVKVFTEQSRTLGITGILDEAPIPPRRKVSPKNLEVQNPTIEITSNNDSREQVDGSEDLIKF